MTLVEVVAGLALLGSLLVTLLLAKTHLARQRTQADSRLDAIAAADDLLARWHAADRPIPRQAAGQTGPGDRFRWATTPLRTQHVATESIQVIRLSLTDAHAPGGQPLATVDLLATEGKSR